MNSSNYEAIMKLTSPAFEHAGKIPMKYTCEGKNINPELHISEVHSKALSLVLLMDDPDVPKSLRPDGMYDHWVIYNIPQETKVIAENCQPPGVRGKTTSDTLSYVGPCPPDREHRYFFKLYALDTLLDLHEGATKKEVEEAMEGHVIEECELMGTYNKRKNQKQ